MPFLQLRDSRYPLREGVNRIGWGAEAEVRLPAPAEGPAEPQAAAVATVQVAGGGAALSGAAVRLNGVSVQEPTPLLHGDSVQVAGWELRFGDEALLGDTVPLSIDQDAPIAVPSPAAATSRGGGRLVSQTDGREYPVGVDGLMIGRDPTCHVVVSRPDVSRRHLTIRETPAGYLLLDTSTNGVLVNGARVLTEVPLGRGDTIRVGLEEFRFHADRSEAAVAAAVPQLASTGTFAAARRPAPKAPELLLGTLEVRNEGPSKGTRYELRSPRVDVGRGLHNDVVIADESVSDSHAKLQLREDGWYLSDLGSTNGTYVGGERLQGDMKIVAGSDLRFGGVKVVFRPSGPTARPSGETRVIVGVKGPDPKRAAERLKELAEHATEEPSLVPAASRLTPWLWLVLLALVALVLWAVTGGEP
ncbi:MAG: FHA domain-containing protein [Gemmatimonadetes bacterium]|nr:FHA domain-containing protein [Gemmatimonadota bacterium]